MNKKFKMVLMIAFVTSLMGQVYINPFNSHFRLSLGVAILIFSLITLKDIPIILTGFISSISIVMFRTILDILQLNIIDLSSTISIILNHIPSAIFYIILSITIHLLNLRDYEKKPIVFIFLASLSDVFSNFVEVIIRYEFTKLYVDGVLSSLLIAGFIRSIITLCLIYIFKLYNVLILKEEHIERYNKLLLFTANMKSEIFYLEKTMNDIERTMERSYSIYSGLKNKEIIESSEIKTLRGRLLNLSKDIHEIKKDNQRIVFGIQNLLPSNKNTTSIKLSEILNILKDNSMRVSKSLEKDILFYTDYNIDILIKDYYPLISIINNLISNAIEAIDAEGQIKISVYKENDYIIFNILDNGKGIDEEDLDLVFKPGFSTKFDDETGRLSSGVGLTHVKHLVNDYYNGKIEVESVKNKMTIFKIYIPNEKLAGNGER